MLRLFRLANAREIPEPYGCVALAQALDTRRRGSSNEEGEVEEPSREDAVDAAEDCRKKPVEWASATALRFQDRVEGRAGSLEEQLVQSLGRSIASTNSAAAAIDPGVPG